MTQQPLQADPTTVASGSTLAYLFADRFVLKAEPGKTGMTAFGTGAVVQTMELSAGLVAIALWQLREKGAVSMETYHAKRLGFISTQGVNLRFVQTVPAGGVEKAALDELAGSKRGREGRETAFDVANMLCRKGKDPRFTTINMAIDDAITLGCIERVQQRDVGMVGRMTGHGSKLEPHADRIQPLAAAAQQLAEQWRDFRKGEEELAGLLRSTTFDGINTRVRAAQAE